MTTISMKAALVVVSAGLLLSACAQPPREEMQLAPAPLPSSLEIAPPGADVPGKVAAFSGVWEGTWGTALDGKLAVEEVRPDGSVSVVYAWGENPGRFGPGLERTTGQVSGNVLTLRSFDNGARATYEMVEPDILRGEYVLSGDATAGEFRRRSDLE